ncbi:dephospho-CoA kinase domain-containing protein-like [Actinia tenebrosa]|uniref:Dephospho-CoA kinase domain-containing protein n=1 Tax=Actinia tenebrosa TaxID=6105 RepID=A0A6P8I7W7_ACTTE|nr:dephospho-CoA kinase domain-containing protein-like [Actinia tenebrosa]
MLIIGLTGGIATGKSTVSQMFKSLGCPLIDADEIAREVVQPNEKSWKKIVKHFGQEVLQPSGEIDREKLGKIIFADPAKRKVLNDSTHPYIYRVILWKLLMFFLAGERFVILDLPLLYETEVVLSITSQVIVVYCEESTQIERLMQRNNLSREEAIQRIESQMPLSEKCKRATFLVDNSGSQEETKAQVLSLYDEFKSSYLYLRLRIPAIMICGALNVLIIFYTLRWIGIL